MCTDKKMYLFYCGMNLFEINFRGGTQFDPVPISIKQLIELKVEEMVEYRKGFGFSLRILDIA